MNTISFVGALETSAPLEGTHRIRSIRLIRCYFYFSKDADINPLFRLIRSKKSEQKKVGNSVSISRVLFLAPHCCAASLLSFIYYASRPASPAFYPPPSQWSDGTPSNDGIHELAAPRWYSPMITHRLVVSYTTFSPLPHTRRGGCFLLPTPAVADSFYFRKWGSLCCPDFPLLRLCTAATEPRHCFQQTAKLLKIVHSEQFLVVFLFN